MEDCICGSEALMDSPTFSPSRSPDRSLYVHIPFCRHRCGYCNFTLVAGRDDLVDRFLQALAKEISWLNGRHTVQTLFLGGGTPSHLNAHQLEQLFDILYCKFDIAELGEVSVECNPNDLDIELANTFNRRGVNRISFGVQSFDPKKLEFLERDHTSSDVAYAVQLAKQFTDNISLDLIFATENEFHDTWISDLENAISLQPNHLSTYELTIEKGTQFWNRVAKDRILVPDDDQKTERYLSGIQFLGNHGFEQYEISSFSKPGFRCRHNQGYWSGKDYFAFGPGASRYVDGIRESNHRSTTTYIKRIENGASPVAERQLLNQNEIATDLLMFGLRQIDGVSVDVFKQLTSFDIGEFTEKVSDLYAQGLMTIENGHCKLTQKGIMLYDSIASRIFSELS